MSVFVSDFINIPLKSIMWAYIFFQNFYDRIQLRDFYSIQHFIADNFTFLVMVSVLILLYTIVVLYAKELKLIFVINLLSKKSINFKVLKLVYSSELKVRHIRSCSHNNRPSYCLLKTNTTTMYLLSNTHFFIFTSNTVLSVFFCLYDFIWPSFSNYSYWYNFSYWIWFRYSSITEYI